MFLIFLIDCLQYTRNSVEINSECTNIYLLLNFLFFFFILLASDRTRLEENDPL